MNGLMHTFMLYLSFQVTLTGDLDSTILELKSGLKVAFYNRWTYGHQCDGAGCGTHLVFDAGMTPHRPVCGAKLSGVRVFPTAGVTTLIGCPRMPMPNSKYCAEHKDCDMPVVESSAVAKETREKLFRKRKETSKAEETPGDDFYVIESIVEVKREKSTKFYKIKWAGFTSDENTWEPEESVPRFIKEYYKDEENLGKPLPKPFIKHTKNIGNSEYHYLHCLQ